MKRKKRDDFIDDGRTVADMSGVGSMFSPAPKPAKSKPEESDEPDVPKAEPLTREQARWAAFAAMRAALLVAGVFIGAMALFVLFCVYVWFR